MNNSLETMSQRIRASSHLGVLSDVVEDTPMYIVGGAVRDSFLDLPITDIDLVAPDDPTAIAKMFSRKSGGSWFWLDRERLQSRVVFGTQKDAQNFDFAPFRASDLEGDLADRDFTINAVALDFSTHKLHDPLSGLDDLSHGILRAAGDDAFRNDPLRIIKGVRHAVSLDFSIDAKTKLLMQESSALLEDVAVERIRQEFWRILNSANAGKGLALLQDCDACRVLLGDSFCAQMDSFELELKSCQSRWDYLAESHASVNGWLETIIEEGLTRKTLLLFVRLLSQGGPDLPRLKAEQWLLSKKSRTNIARLADTDASMISELDSVAQNARALSWWVDRYGVEPKLLFLYLACLVEHNKTHLSGLAGWLNLVEGVPDERLTDLVYGRWLTDCLGIEEGPEISRALELLRNAEIAGEVADEEEAREFLSRVYLDKD